MISNNKLEPTIQNNSIRIEQEFTKVANKHSSKIAVVSENTYITYDILEKKSFYLALRLQALENKRNILIAICLDRCIDYVIGILGILKSGSAFLPIDNQYPDERIEFIIKDSNINVVITHRKYISKFEKYASNGLNLFIFDDELDTADLNIGTTNQLVPNLNNSINLAYVIYTSGSSGAPKGVMIQHQSVINLVKWHLKEFNISSEENSALFSSFSFDASIWELFPYLLNGNTIFLCSENIKRNLSDLNSFYEHNKIRIAFLPTAVCELFFEYKNTSLRILLTGGEKLTKKPNKCNKYIVVNNYGPTENTVVTTFSYVKSNEEISIGKPIQNVDIYILDKKGNRVSGNNAGELCIAGAGLFFGYLNNPKLTAERLLEYPLDNQKTVRVYKTGDLVKRVKNGCIKFLGRLDEQVKVRGYRVDILEIEKYIKSIENIKDCAVIQTEEANGKFLVAYYVVNDNFSIPSHIESSEYLKDILQKKVPNFMIPQHFININSIPLTFNGKKDKNLLSNKAFKICSNTNYILPTTETQKHLASIWEKLLNASKIGIRDNFFYLGSTSFICMQALLEIDKQFFISLTLEDLCNNPCIEKLSILCEAKHKNNIEIKKSCGVNEIPLIPMQKQMWMFNKTDRENQYNIPIILSLDGNITKEKLIHCFRKIAVRHEVFRTTISDQNNIAIQKIHANLDSNTLKIIDLIKYKFPFDLALKMIKEDIDKLIFKKDDFLFRVKLFLLAENKFILYLNINHCIFDDWSLKILYKDFESLYNKKALSKLPVKYKDYSISHLEYTKEKYESGLKFWKKSLLGIDYTLNLMTDYAPNKKDNGEGKKYFFTINSIMTENLKVYAKENNTTLFIFFLSALYILLKNYSQQTRFCIGTVFANRDQSITKDLVGCFINTVAIPISSGFNITFYKLMKDIEKIVLQAHKFQFIPFSEVVDVINPCREEGKTPIFQVMLNMLNPDRPKLNLKGVNTKNLYIEHNVSVFDLSFIIEAIDDEIKMSIQYKTSLFKEKSIIRMGTHFTNILKEVLNNNFQDISHINLLALDEFKLVTDTFAKGKKSNLYPKDMDIIEIFEEIVFSQPEKIAIQFGKINLTYKDLLDKSHILSHYLKSLDLPIESIIGIYMEKSPSVIISMLSILKAGYAYLPLDIEYPADRIKYIIHDSSLKVVITTDKLVQKLNSFNLNLLITDLNFNNINFFKTSNVKLQLGKHNCQFNSFRATKLAYVIYTSGSTGKPKGVMAEHRGVVRLVKNTNYININGNDIFALFSSLSFDAATFEIWGALLNGAKLIIPIKSKLSLYDIANIIEKNFVTIIFLTSILFKLVVGRYCNKLSSLKSLLSGGEVVDFNNEVKYFLNANKASSFIHVYGPTENTTFTSYYAIKEKFENYSRIPIGIPIANTSIYILDDYLKPAPIGVPGTIYTSGDGLSRGYINNLALTSEKFISNPIENSFHSFLYNTGDTARWMSDGNIEFIGRSDNQIKIRGFRVEIEEIEKLINSNFNIRESVVISQGLGEDKQLVAYYTVKDTSQFEETTEIVIRESLKRELPQYMLPSYFIQVSKIPFTPNGKIDKQKLIASYHCPVKKKHIPAENELQKKLVSIWEKILKTKPIGINDNFFDLGGSSIKNILIIDVLKKNGIYLDVQDIFTYETISGLSTHINNYDLSINNYVNLSVNKRTYINEEILTPSQRFIFSLNGKDINKSNVGMLFYLSKKIDFTTLKSALEKLINHHDVLRLKFKSTASGWKPIYDIFLINDCLNVVTFVTNNKKSILKKIDYIKDELNNNFDIENKPLISICLLQLPNSSGNNILFVSMHHLITDAFSWKIFIEDLSSCLDNPNLVLQNKSDSYNFWAQRLNNISNSIMMKDQQDFWLSIITQTNEVESLLESNNQHSSHKEEEIVLSKEVTRYIKDISKKTRTKIDELLLAILYLSYKQWTKKNVMSILLLNNGRNAPFHDLSIVRTMGLFTIYYPVIFNNFFTVENFIKSLTDIKNTLRKISFDGMGYCLLRYSAENFFSEITLLQPDITFNYMGDFGSRKISNLLTRIDDITNRNITRELTYDGLSIVGMEFDGEINIVFGTSAKFKKSRTINGLTEAFKKNVELITNQLKSLEATSISDINPSLFISLKSGSQKSENNTHPPVIFIPGQNGTCVTFRQIVKRFKLPMSVYGVQTYGLNEQESPFSTIEAMAEHNIKLLKMHYSKGPYIFIGYSYGGTVAFEMAYQLKNLFDDDAMVILIDAPPHQSLNIASPLNYIDNAINYLNRSFGLNIPIKLILLDLEKVRNIPSARYAANINTFILQIIRNYVNNENSSMLNNLLLLYHAQITATYSFVDKSIQEMTILLAKELISEGDISNAMRERITEWENYVNGTIKYIHVPGDHFSLFNDPNVEIVSKVLQDRILSFIEDSSFAIS